jgi:TfoX/Sxy family transcriptional regulator of competence genes
MAYNAQLLERIRAILSSRKDVVEKKMFGGVAFMVGGNMACGPHGDRLLARIGDAATAAALAEPHVKPMDFTGKVMKSFVAIVPEGMITDAQLRRWVELAAAYAASLKSKPKRPAAASRRTKKAPPKSRAARR